MFTREEDVGMMGTQTSCQGDAGKVSFEFSSLVRMDIECVNAVEFCLRVC